MGLCVSIPLYITEANIEGVKLHPVVRRANEDIYNNTTAPTHTIAALPSNNDTVTSGSQGKTAAFDPLNTILFNVLFCDIWPFSLPGLLQAKGLLCMERYM